MGSRKFIESCCQLITIKNSVLSFNPVDVRWGGGTSVYRETPERGDKERGRGGGSLPTKEAYDERLPKHLRLPKARRCETYSLLIQQSKEEPYDMLERDVDEDGENVMFLKEERVDKRK